MTLLEKLKQNNPKAVEDAIYCGIGCPSKHGISTLDSLNCPDGITCQECWNQQVEDDYLPMPYEARKAIYNRAIEHFSPSLQKQKAIEEMAELIQAVCKDLTGSADLANIAEELADVTIMAEQLRLIYGCNDVVNRYIDKKLERLSGRMEALE